jgi:hypothetical protein
VPPSVRQPLRELSELLRCESFRALVGGMTHLHERVSGAIANRFTCAWGERE